MEPMNLLVVERDADWSQWALISRALSHTVLVLVQQADETIRAFHERVARRLKRGVARPLNKVVVLRNSQSARAFDAAQDQLLRELSAQAQEGLRIYPFNSPSAVTAAVA
jgi:hypothetical protein